MKVAEVSHHSVLTFIQPMGDGVKVHFPFRGVHTTFTPSPWWAGRTL